MNSKKTKSELNQAQVDVSKSKTESEVKAHSKVIKKIEIKYIYCQVSYFFLVSFFLGSAFFPQLDFTFFAPFVLVVGTSNIVDETL